jgi:hypothetical protein
MSELNKSIVEGIVSEAIEPYLSDNCIYTDKKSLSEYIAKQITQSILQKIESLPNHGNIIHKPDLINLFRGGE